MPFDPKDPEAIVAINAAVDAATGELSEKVGNLSKENAKWRRLAQGKDGIDPAEFEKLSELVDQRTAERDASIKQAKEATKAAETAQKALTNESGFTQRLLIDNGLTQALTAHGVTNATHLKAAQAMLRGQVQIVADGENRIAKVGDKALTDYVKEWAAGDEGKFFVAAAQNGGGGAPGGSGKQTSADIMKLPPVERMNAARQAQHA